MEFEIINSTNSKVNPETQVTRRLNCEYYNNLGLEINTENPQIPTTVRYFLVYTHDSVNFTHSTVDVMSEESEHSLGEQCSHHSKHLQ